MIDPYNDETTEVKFVLGKCHILQSNSDMNLAGCKTDDPDPNNQSSFNLTLLIKLTNLKEDAPKNEYFETQIVKNEAIGLIYNTNLTYNEFRETITNVKWNENSNTIFDNFDKESFNTISSNDIYVYPDNSMNPYFSGIHSSFSFSLDKSTRYVNRIFPKLLILLSKVMLMSLLIRYFLRLIYFFFADHFFLQIFVIYFIKYNEKAMKKLKEEHLIIKDLKNDAIEKFIITDIFTVKNFILSYFSNENPKSNLYKALVFEMMPCLSMERILCNNLEEKINIVEYFDLMTNQKLFGVNGNWRFKTIFGGFSSFLLVFLVILFVYYEGSSFFLRQNSKVSISNLYPSERDLKYWVNSKGPLMIYTTDISDYPSYFVVLDHIVETVFEISAESCTEEIFKLLEIERKPYYKYACVDLSQLLPKIHEVIKYDGRFVSFSVTSCQEWKTYRQQDHEGTYNPFASHPCPNETIKTNKTVEVGLKTKFKFFDHENSNTEDVILDIKNSNNDGNMFAQTYYLWENQLEDDVGLITPDNKKSFFTSILNKNQEDYQNFVDGIFGRLFITFYQTQTHYNLFERRFTKLSDFLVNLITIIRLLVTFLQNVTLIINNFYFYKYFLQRMKKTNVTTRKSKRVEKISHTQSFDLLLGKVTPEKFSEAKEFKNIYFDLNDYLSYRFCIFRRKHKKTIEKKIKKIKIFLSIEKSFEISLKNYEKIQIVEKNKGLYNILLYKY